MTDCARHSGHDNEPARIPLDGIMRALDNNQAGEGRHKCPYCAYEQGVRQGRRESRQEIIESLRDFIREQDTRETGP